MTQNITSIARHNPIRTGIFAIVGVIALGVAAGFALGYNAPTEASAQVVTLPGVVVVAPPVVPPPPVIVPVVPVIPPPVVTPPVTELPGITVTGDRSDSDDDDPFGPPCCTEPPTPQPPVVTDDPFGPPCCTEPLTPTGPTNPPVFPPVPPVPPLPPTTSDAICVSLSASASTILPGQAVTLSWKTVNATSISIDNGIGEVTPVANGSIVVNPTQDTIYTATVTGASSSDNCRASVTISPTTQPAQCVFLNGTPSVINSGDPVRLAWRTLNASSISIDNGVGVVTPTAEGFVIVNPTQTTTYRATVTGVNGSVHCQTTVIVTTIEQGPMCVSLTANRTSIDEGDSVTLSWVTTRASSVSIDNGVGVVTPTASGSVTVRPDNDTTYTATVPNAPFNSNCRVSISVDDDDGGGGGGGGGRRSPRVGLESFVPELEEPLSFVYLSEVPHTGLELGAFGTALYWIMLIGWSAALAYLVLFNAVPFALARAKRFGGNVKEALQSPVPEATGHQAAVAHATASVADHAHDTAHGAHPAPAKPQGYSAHDGFRSFAAGEGLTIDDIVKGLSREIEQKHEAPAHAEVLQAVREEAPVPPPAPSAPRSAPGAAPAAAPMNENVRDFIAALLNGDRDTVFGIIRSMARQGEDTEAFVSHAACALDDAYRACIDGTTCHPDIAELTNGCHPSYLERLVASLTTAVDGSYSAGMTGVKMALTRALGVVAG